MKMFIFAGLMMSSVPALAGQNWMYCKHNGVKIELTSAEGYLCADALLAGETCFTGDRARTVGFLNSQAVRGFFAGPRYIKDVTGNSEGNVSYLTVDETSGKTSPQSMKRCLNSFFF